MGIYEQVIEVCKKNNNKIFSTSEIQSLVKERYDSNVKEIVAGSIIPSDYCYNRINEGIDFTKHIFIYEDYGKYNFVGENYTYSGKIYFKSRGSGEERTAGEWNNGSFYLWEKFPKVSIEHYKPELKPKAFQNNINSQEEFGSTPNSFTNTPELQNNNQSVAEIKISTTNLFDQFQHEPPDVEEKKQQPQIRASKFTLNKDFESQDAINKELGKDGEEWVIQIEKERLNIHLKPDLASKVEWVSKTRGDGLGYDILSYDYITNKEMYIEVKTTNNSEKTSFFITRNELCFCKNYKEQYKLYRVFHFNDIEKRGFFVLSSEELQKLRLVPLEYMVTF